MSFEHSPRIIFANTVNQLMLAVPTAAHSAVLAAVSPRKLWLAVEGDLVLTMKPISPEFKRYACSLMSIDPDRIDTLTPVCSDTSFLAEAVKDKVILNRLLRFIDANPSAQFLSYALDYPTWNLIEQLGIKVTHYSRSISPLLQQHIFRLNRKSAFRQVAASLGLPVVPGGSCDGLKALTELAASMLTKYGKIIVKLDRSSNGYGHLVLTQRSLTSSLKTQLQEHYRKYETQPAEFTVERLMPFLSVPSVEMMIAEDEIKVYYICDQRCRNRYFSGMVTPARNLPQTLEKELRSAGERFARFLQELGYRGIFDLDAGVTSEGELFFTETNIRRTAGTHLHELACRLAGQDYLSKCVWVSDVRATLSSARFEDGVAILKENGLSFSPTTQKGTILIVDTEKLDRKWRYLIIAGDTAEADFLEKRLAKILRFTND